MMLDTWKNDYLVIMGTKPTPSLAFKAQGVAFMDYLLDRINLEQYSEIYSLTEMIIGAGYA